MSIHDSGNNPIDNKTGYWHNLDLMKAIGILMVLCLHVPLTHIDYAEGWPSFYVQYVLRLIAEGVPVFVMVNGFLLFSKTAPDLKKHYGKAFRLLLIFVIWGCILTFAGAVGTNEQLTVRKVSSYLLLTDVGSPHTGVLWFLQNLLSVYLVFPALKFLFDRDFSLYQLLFCIYGIYSVGYSTLVLFRDAFGTMTDVFLLNDFLFFVRRFTPVANEWYFFYFCLGGMVYHYADQFRIYRKMWIMAGILCWGAAAAFGLYMSKAQSLAYNPAFNYGSVFMLVFLCGLFSMTLPFVPDHTAGRLVALVGKNSMGIYLSHFLFIWSADALLNRAGIVQPYGIAVRGVKYVLVLMASFLFSLVIGKIPYLKKLVQT